MGLFSKKNCDICGGDMGRITDNKMADGGICHDCAKKLSPWFTSLRKSTKAEVEEQLAYREQNKQAVAAFKTTRVFGQGREHIYIDDNVQNFMVTKTQDIPSENPDVIPISAVTGCFVEPKESHYEETRTNNKGESVSYMPPRFVYNYDVWLTINLNHKYFDKISIKINRDTVTIQSIGNMTPDIMSNYEYKGSIDIAEEAKTALTDQGAAAAATAAFEASKPVKCKACGAIGIPDSRGCCDYCGAPLA